MRSELPEGWRWSKIQHLLEPSTDIVDINDNQEYTQVTVRMHHRGIVARERQLGVAIGTKRQNRLSAGQFIISKIDARNGACGIVPLELEGAIATLDFPAFQLARDLDSKFFDYYTATTEFVQACRNVSIGTTNRSRLQMDSFGDILIPLPPGFEQQIIGNILRTADDAIEAVARAIAAAEEIKRGIMQHSFDIISTCPKVALGTFMQRIRRDVQIIPDAEYFQIGIRSHGRGIFLKDPVLGKSLGSKKLYWIEEGDFVLNIVFAWEGAVAIAPQSNQRLSGSHRFPTYSVDEAICDPNYLLWYFKTPTGVEQLGDVSPGGAGRNRTLNQSAFVRLSVPLPSLNEQKYIATTLTAQDDALLALRAEYDSLQDVKRGLMGDLFSGRVRVQEISL